MELPQEECVASLKAHLHNREAIILHQTKQIELLHRSAKRRHPDLVADVMAFHLGCQGQDPTVPSLPSEDDRKLRWSLIDEEVNRELKPAMDIGDLVGVADAIADAIYVLIGTALRYGIPLYAVWNEVQESNMSKFVNGRATYREDGKILKGLGFRKPNIEGVLKVFAA